MEPFSLPIPAPTHLAEDYEEPFSDPPSPARARPPPSEHIQVVRELWVLRERGAVRALEPDFLMRLALLLGGGVRVREARREDASWVRASRPSSENNEPNTDTDVFVESPTMRVREPPPGSRPDDTDTARAQQRVTGLSPSFRARLEGMEAGSQGRTTSSIQRTDSWEDLDEQRAVTNALESAFRHELEGVLVRRGTRNDARLYAQRQRYGGHIVERTSNHDLVNLDIEEPGDHDHDMRGRGSTTMAIHALREEVAALKQMMDASFDVSLDIQRAVRQEVAAALNAHNHTGKKLLQKDADNFSSNRNGNRSRDRALPEVASSSSAACHVRPFNGGTCSICLDRQIDSLLYACGHMTCTPCGRQLLAHGENCHVCRAPVRDVVRCFFS